MHLKLDPWTASSLLQKAIRRGEIELAQYAAKVLHRYRGTGIWSRLITIAVEDVGIADLNLVLEVTRFGTDKALRSVLASDSELIADLAVKLAGAPKDRCADYLHSAAVRRMSKDKSDLFARDAERQMIETGEQEALVCEGERLLHCATTRAARSVIDDAAVGRLFKDGTYAPNTIMDELIERFARSRAHPFTLMLLPLWSALCKATTQPEVRRRAVPKAEYIAGVPSYVFDKHTAVGKSAIRRFAHENREMRRVLSLWVVSSHRVQVAETAAFYADAMPVSRKFLWERSEALEALGCRADMAMAGCEVEGIQAVLMTMRDNLEDLNTHRRRAVGGAKK
jgi:hypothetical protein